MPWFNEQIKQDAINQSKYPLECFVKLLHMYNHTGIEPFSLTQVDEVLNGWLKKGTIHNSTYRRRYLIIQQDLHHLFANERRNSQNPGASSPFDCHHGPKEIHSPGLSFKQEDNGMKREKEDTVLPHDMDHSTRISAAGQFISLTSAGTVEIDKPVQPPDMEHMDVVSPQLPSDTQSQDAGADAVIMALETTVIDSSSGAKMSRKSTRNRGRKPKFHRDAPEPSSPPKNYICKRCNKPGHWIQYCPTNLDPLYDQKPTSDYRCNFCGRKGVHFATLCPRNPHESSLTKQRECVTAENQEPRTPTSGAPHYLDRDVPVIRSRDRYRSRSPKQRSWGHYRSRSPERYHSRRSGTDIYSPRYRSEGDMHLSRFKDEVDVSPYTTRARLTRELYVSSDTTEGREPSLRSWDDPFHSQRRPGSNSPPHCYSPFSKKGRQRYRDLDEKRTEEGRLAYDDEIDIFIGPKSSPCSPVAHSSQQTLSTGEDKVAGLALPSAMVVPEGSDKAKDETDGFLRALAADIMLKDSNNSRPMVANTYGIEMEVDCRPSREIYTDGSHGFDTSNQPESPTVKAIPGPKHRLVSCPPFSSKVVSLFFDRENPIINVRINRKTASQMMVGSECFLPLRRKQVDEAITAPTTANRAENCVRAT
ncbi:hypothetical protein F5X98DRAFT_382468 [Xylaria grammica]|nr:hypothetical protein F5X98DRAFT_382468 [Xylaria grammica]